MDKTAISAENTNTDMNNQAVTKKLRRVGEKNISQSKNIADMIVISWDIMLYDCMDATIY